MSIDPIEQFRVTIEAAGFIAPDEIVADGRIHRFSVTGKRRDDSGWYVLHLDNMPAGVFGDWRTGESQTWCSKSDREMSLAERQALRAQVKAAQQQREEDDAARKISAAARAAEIWNASLPALAHPYLLAKQVKTYGLRIGQWPRWQDGVQTWTDNVLIVPMRDAAGKLWSLQGIDPEGGKLFLPGGRVKGCYHALGRASGRVIIGEGYATCATVHEATGDAVAVAFNASNLQPVARALRGKYPTLSIVIAADDDYRTRDPRTGELTNPGLNAARKAAAAVGGKIAIPDFSGYERGEHHTDWNDLCRLAGSVVIGGAA